MSLVTDLRAAHEMGSIVVIGLDGRCRWPRLRGRVERVSPTGALAWITPTTGPGRGGEQEIPTDCIVSVTVVEYGKPLRSAA